MKYNIYPSLHEDIDAGWVWLGTTVFPSRSIVKIRNCKNDKAVYCEALQIENNFRRKYSESEDRISIKDPSSALVINCWYRKRLGDLPTKSEAELEITSADGFRGRLCACFQHPQIVVRIGTYLACISIGLGIVGVVLGGLSLLR